VAATNWIGLAGSYVLVFLVIGVATALLRSSRVDAAGARKIIHIGVSHWWILAMLTMDDPWVASIGPASFIVLNLVSLRTGLFSAMEEGKQARNWGTVYFPISLLVLVNLCFRGAMPKYVGALGALVMGWGDGLAAVVGGRRERAVRIGLRGSRKSLAGSAVMFAVSFAVTAVLAVSFEPAAPLTRTLLLAPAATAALATAVELFTPWGLDNLTVPLLTAGFYRLAFVAVA
jgi:phytol kinase